MFVTFESKTEGNETLLHYKFRHEKDLKINYRNEPKIRIVTQAGKHNVLSLNELLFKDRPSNDPGTINITKFTKAEIEDLKKRIVKEAKAFNEDVNEFNKLFAKETKYKGRFWIDFDKNKITMLPKGKRIKPKPKTKKKSTTKLKLYRIKTEKEFISEFGDNWRSIVLYSFIGKMDKLFGRPLIKDAIEKLEMDKLYMDPYHISKDMVIEIKSTSTKKPKDHTKREFDDWLRAGYGTYRHYDTLGSP